MATPVPLYIKSGLPFERTIVVTLPSPRDWWTISTEFEVLSQIRESKSYTSPLRLDLKPYLTMDFDGANTVTVTLEMTGSDTRKLNASGNYDMILSDVNTLDNRAYEILSGQVYQEAIVTGASAI